jgi:CP family cyanate transporter-like MFS transporter
MLDQRSRRVPTGLGAAAVILVLAVNLRAGLTGLAPVLDEVRSDSGLSRSTAGLLTSLPVLCFGLLAPPAAWAGRRWGLDSVAAGAMAFLVMAFTVRSYGGVTGLFVGTALAGAAIAFGNVLLPSLVKRDFPSAVEKVTALYVTALTGGSALAAGISVPLAQDAGWGWHHALVVWTLPAALAAFLLATRTRRRARNQRGAGPAVGVASGFAVWRSSLAWRLAAYNGAQTLLFFAVVTWLPDLLHEAGVSRAAGGSAVMAFTLVGVPASLLSAQVSRWLGHRDALVVPCGLWGIGLVGLTADPRHYLLWAALLGAAQGLGLSLALAQIAVRTKDGQMAGDLAGMTQSLAFILGAGGPWAVGALRDASGGWTAPVVALLAVAAVMLAAGLATADP